MLRRLQSFFNPPDTGDRMPRRIFWVALAVRLLYITLAHTYRIRPANDHFEFGWEMGRVARALATGRGFADPFEGHTGPTAWVPPLYPLLLGAVFRLFGVYTQASASVILAMNSVFSALTAPAVYAIARRAFADRTDVRKLALWSAWLWALYPAALQYAVKWVWEMSLTTCLFAWVILLALALRENVPGPPQDRRHPGKGRIFVFAPLAAKPSVRWLLYGLLWGSIALSNSSLLVFLPVCTLWIIWPRPIANLRNIALAAAVCLAVLAPWTIRNQLVFHAFVPLRSNFGAELYESADFSNEGYPSMATLPHSEAAPEFKRYKSLGELAYTREQGARATALIRAHPGIFLNHLLRRIWFFWVSVPHPADGVKGILNETLRELNYAFLSITGLLGLALALRDRIPAAPLFGLAMATIPLLYYAISVQARFRHPLEPLLCILAVYLFGSTGPRKRTVVAP